MIRLFCFISFLFLVLYIFLYDFYILYDFNFFVFFLLIFLLFWCLLFEIMHYYMFMLIPFYCVFYEITFSFVWVCFYMLIWFNIFFFIKYLKQWIYIVLSFFIVLCCFFINCVRVNFIGLCTHQPIILFFQPLVVKYTTGLYDFICDLSFGFFITSFLVYFSIFYCNMVDKFFKEFKLKILLSYFSNINNIILLYKYNSKYYLAISGGVVVFNKPDDFSHDQINFLISSNMMKKIPVDDLKNISIPHLVENELVLLNLKLYSGNKIKSFFSSNDDLIEVVNGVTVLKSINLDVYFSKLEKSIYFSSEEKQHIMSILDSINSWVRSLPETYSVTNVYLVEGKRVSAVPLVDNHVISITELEGSSGDVIRFSTLWTHSSHWIKNNLPILLTNNKCSMVDFFNSSQPQFTGDHSKSAIEICDPKLLENAYSFFLNNSSKFNTNLYSNGISSRDIYSSVGYFNYNINKVIDADTFKAWAEFKPVRGYIDQSTFTSFNGMSNFNLKKYISVDKNLSFYMNEKSFHNVYLYKYQNTQFICTDHPVKLTRILYDGVNSNSSLFKNLPDVISNFLRNFK